MENSQKTRSKTRGKRRMKTVLLCLCLLLAVGAVIGALFVLLPALEGDGQQTQETVQRTITQVETGDIERRVYGSGSVQPIRQPGVYAKVDAEVARTLVEMGDRIEEGDILMVLESETLSSEERQLQSDLDDAQDNVRAVETYSRYTYQQLYWEDGRPRIDVHTGEPLTARYSNELCIRAPVAGRVVAVYIEPGDDALAVYREKGAVIVLSTDGRSKVELQDVEPGKLALNDVVTISGEGVNVTGRVENLSRHGMQATIVIIGDEYGMDVPVDVYAQDGTRIGGGSLTVNKPLMISAYGGLIRAVDARVGRMVEDNEILAHFTWTGTPLYIDNDSVLHDYAVAAAALEAVRTKMDHLTVTAPCSGTVASVEFSAGDSVVSGDKLITIVEDAGMQIILQVDELDIPLVAQGQRTVMTADALDGVTIEGEVLKIAPIGNTETAVTTYDVYIQTDKIDERVLGGMNISGEIIAESVKDALLIPTDAIMKDEEGYFVTMEDGELRRIETGIMTVETTQVLSGLSTGEKVAY